METETSTASSSSSRSRAARDRYLYRVLAPSIKDQTCLICLSEIQARRAALLTSCLHSYCVGCIEKWSARKKNCPLCNAKFDSWFYRIDLSSRTFRIQKFPSADERMNLITQPIRRSRRLPVEFDPRIRRRIREKQRSRPLPQMRTFGQAGSVSSELVADRVLQWRASIYKRHLQAIPSTSSRNFSQQNAVPNKEARERMIQRIEPWIRRELKAILGDLDPSVIVHVVTSAFMSWLEVSTEHVGGADEFLKLLKPFLRERTNMFWHELRCYAESSLNMGTYDEVVKYEHVHQQQKISSNT